MPLLEIVSEPDLHTAEEVRAYAMALRTLLRYLGVNSGDMQKGIMRIEPNISVRPVGSQTLGTRTEIKNLNSFRALERAVDLRDRTPMPSCCARAGGWCRRRSAGTWHPGDHRLAAQQGRRGRLPLLPRARSAPAAWSSRSGSSRCARSLPELPDARLHRFQRQYGLSAL